VSKVFVELLRLGVFVQGSTNFSALFRSITVVNAMLRKIHISRLDIRVLLTLDDTLEVTRVLI
jgi:hypothetical protein